MGTVEGRGCGSPGTREAPPRRAAETAPRLAADGRAGQRGPRPQPPALAGPKVSLGGAGRTKALLCSGSGLLPDGTSHRKPQEATGSPFLGPDCRGSHLRQGLPSPWDGAGRKGRAQEPRTQDWGPLSARDTGSGLPAAPPLPGSSTSGLLHFRVPPLPGSPRSAGVAPGSLAAAAPAPAGWVEGGWRVGAPAQPSLGTVPDLWCQAQGPCSPLLTLLNVGVLTGRWEGPVTPLPVKGRPAGASTN